MESIAYLNSIEEYNNLFGHKTMHPLVNYIEYDAPQALNIGRRMLGFYCLFLKETQGCVINYGKTKYDFDDQTIVCMAPGQTVEFLSVEGKPAKAKGIIFHPDFIHGTQLEKKMKTYTFFSYASNEALHLSEDERITIISCMRIIKSELQHPIDRHSRNLVCSNIELILDYCLRFYERQFATRQDLNITTLSRFEELVNDYISSGRMEREGLPTVKYFAEKVFLSPNYFGDMVKAETGKTAREYISLRLFDYAKKQLATTDMSVKQIAALLGFKHSPHFVRFFKKHSGTTPTEYRKAI